MAIKKGMALIIAVIITCTAVLAGCGEEKEKVYYEPGTVERPYNVEEYRENGLNYRKEKYLGYEITYPLLDKYLTGKTFVQECASNYTCYSASYPSKDPNDTYEGESFTRYIYHKAWSLPEDIEREGLESVTYTVYNRPGSFVKQYQYGEVTKPFEEYSLGSSCTVDADYDGELYLCTFLELYGNEYEMTDEEAEKYIKDAFDGTFIGVRADYDSGVSEEAYYYIEYDFISLRAGAVFYEYLLYRLT
mgnify:CR=1 FL=1